MTIIVIMTSSVMVINLITMNENSKTKIMLIDTTVSEVCLVSIVLISIYAPSDVLCR